jgi:hypothetical protein
MNQLEYIGLRVLPTRYLQSIRNLSKTLLETGCVARVDMSLYVHVE